MRINIEIDVELAVRLMSYTENWRKEAMLKAFKHEQNKLPNFQEQALQEGRDIVKLGEALNEAIGAL